MCVRGCRHKRERGEEARKERVGRKSGRKESERERKKKQKNPRKMTLILTRGAKRIDPVLV